VILGAEVIAERAPAVERLGLTWGGERQCGVRLSPGDQPHLVLTAGVRAAVLAAVIKEAALGFLVVLRAGHDASPNDAVLHAL
jgi:hypothetical protein